MIEFMKMITAVATGERVADSIEGSLELR